MSTNHNFFEEKRELKRDRAEVLPLTSLTPYRWAKPAHMVLGDRVPEPAIFRAVCPLHIFSSWLPNEQTQNEGPLGQNMSVIRPKHV